MAKKNINWKTKGMNRDISVSAFNPEFAFENVNLRLATNDDNTMLSWVNERGPKEITVAINEKPWDSTYEATDIIYGTVLGTAVIDHKLVLFTHHIQSKADRIYVLWYDEEKTSMSGSMLYIGNLNFSLDYPIETLVSYEADNIEKVYWTDGLNQPRVINIKVDSTKSENWYEQTIASSFSLDYYFDFIPVFDSNISVDISKLQSAGGTFAPGVIQYCLSYINKHGQQSNIVYTSSLYYLAYSDRGASPTDHISSAFRIELSKLDSNFDYIRLYSIQRTSLDDTPTVRLLEDIPIVYDTKSNDYTALYIDNGTTGSTMDPTELLYIGGKEITALTMASKDNTLFLGNIKQNNVLVDSIQNYFDNNSTKYQNELNYVSKLYNSAGNSGSYYSYVNHLGTDSRQITTFKGGETYRFGIQFQKKNGEWTDPIFICDKENNHYPSGSIASNYTYLWSAQLSISITDIATFYDNNKEEGADSFFSTFVKVRPVIVYPTISDRTVLCQGVLNPTLFNIEDRVDGTPFAQPSWYFRPYYSGSDVGDSSNGSTLRFKHYDSLYCQSEAEGEQPHIDDDFFNRLKMVEIQGSTLAYENPFKEKNDTLTTNSQFFIDQSIVTLNSPDLEFDTEVQTYSTDGLSLRIVGVIPITSSASSHNIKISSSMLQANYDSEDSSSSTATDQIFGTGESSMNILHKIADASSYRRLVADQLWNDVFVDVRIEDSTTKVRTGEPLIDYFVYPWNKVGSLNNDSRGSEEATSCLEYKREANIAFSSNTLYGVYKDSDTTKDAAVEYSNIGVQIPLTENAEVMNYRIPNGGSSSSGINYYANIDKVIVGQYYIWHKNATLFSNKYIKKTSPISMKYKSTTHAAISLGSNILPSVNTIGTSSRKSGNTTFWGESVSFTQDNIISKTSTGQYGFLLLGELCKTPTNRFGGSTKAALLANKWLSAGEDKVITENTKSITVVWTEGDTYYQRYDCLKTYPYTEEDANQIIEILSFMCETHVNLDGRYDRNRGQLNNTNIRPTNFNLLNPVYSQRNNFFTYKKVDSDGLTELKYPNQIYYSKTKTSGADVDLWTNVTLASTLELDGDKGSLNSLRRFNDNIIAFQDKGISRILYNDNVVLSTTQGVPVEIANSGKVQGKSYISNTIGCSNKWAMAQTPSGIYFMDSNDKSIYLFNGQLSNISASKGFNAWCKTNIPSAKTSGNCWTPDDFEDFVAYYDKLNQDVMFINKDTALAYSEKMGYFTSFYDYGNTPYFENLDDTGIWVKDAKLWKHQEGDYCNFFGENKPFSMTLVANQEPLVDKIFTNMEFRACIEGEGSYDETTGKFTPILPFDSLEAWNEYQHGIQELSLRTSGATSIKETLARKFRIWRCDIPRDNASLDSDFDGITRFKVRPLDRMRNPWVYLKLSKGAADEDETLSKTEVHDVVATYFGGN